jgi:hypothetical protein
MYYGLWMIKIMLKSYQLLRWKIMLPSWELHCLKRTYLILETVYNEKINDDVDDESEFIDQ